MRQKLVKKTKKALLQFQKRLRAMDERYSAPSLKPNLDN
tara:strand:- start:43828 stop:43944 length:117 start_codon:yes stop_codon:yes gene_type:complete